MQNTFNNNNKILKNKTFLFNPTVKEFEEVEITREKK